MNDESFQRPLITKAARSALRRLAREGMRLRPDPRGGFCVSAGSDARRRPVLRISVLEAKALASEGLVESAGPKTNEQCWRLSGAGRAFLERALAAPPAPLASDSNGEPLAPQSIAMRRLRNLSADGRDWFSAVELQAAQALERDYRLALLTGRVTADWSAPPMDRTQRGASANVSGPDCAIDARTRLSKLKNALGAQAAALLEDVLNSELGLEEIERRRNWPPRSAKVALKMALSMAAERGRET